MDSIDRITYDDIQDYLEDNRLPLEHPIRRMLQGGQSVYLKYNFDSASFTVHKPSEKAFGWFIVRALDASRWGMYLVLGGVFQVRFCFGKRSLILGRVFNYG